MTTRIAHLFSRAPLCFGVGLLLLAGLACDPPEQQDAGPDGGVAHQCPENPDGTARTACRRNLDCGGGSICEKDNAEDTWGCCLKVGCTSDEDCPPPQVCHERALICRVPDCDPADPTGGQYQCGDGELCVYVDGVPLCRPENQLPAIASCRIASPVHTAHGASVEMSAAGFDANGKLVSHARFTYAANVTNGGGAVDGTRITFTCENASPCTGTVTATATRGTGTCNTPVVVFPAVDAADLRVFVFDQTAQAPVAGAPVAARIGDELRTGVTGADGSYVFAGGGSAVIHAVSTFPADHQWQTVISPGSNDVALYTVAVPRTNRVAGVKGKFNFQNTTTSGDIRIGLAGMSISGAITDLDFAMLLGEINDYTIILDGVTDADGENVPLPSGLVIELGADPIKGDFVVFGEPGPRVLWALGGKVRLAEIGKIISSVTASDDVNVGKILGAVIPFFRKFDHAVVSGLTLTEVDRPPPQPNDAPIPYSAWSFPALEGANAVKLNTLLSRYADYLLPDLPCAPGAASGNTCAGNDFLSGAVLLTGVIVPGIGLVPLGLTAGLDDYDDKDNVDRRDGKLDWEPGTDGPQKGHAIIDYAPPHDGLEGNLYVTIAIGIDIDSIASGNLGASTITHVSRTLGERNNTFPGAFLQHQGGTYTKSAGGNRFSLRAVGEAQFYRLNLNDNNGEWNIWFANPSQEIDLAALRPEGVTGRDNKADVQAFRFGTGYEGLAPATFVELSRLNGTNFDNLLYYMGGWSSTSCARAQEGQPAPFCLEVID